MVDDAPLDELADPLPRFPPNEVLECLPDSLPDALAISPCEAPLEILPLSLPLDESLKLTPFVEVPDSDVPLELLPPPEPLALLVDEPALEETEFDDPPPLSTAIPELVIPFLFVFLPLLPSVVFIRPLMPLLLEVADFPPFSALSALIPLPEPVPLPAFIPTFMFPLPLPRLSPTCSLFRLFFPNPIPTMG